MSYDVVESTTESRGSMHEERLVLDITSLEDDGSEPIAADDETRVITRVDHAYIAGQEDPALQVVYNHTSDQIGVVDVSDGSDVSSGTDVGEVELVVVGK